MTDDLANAMNTAVQHNANPKLLKKYNDKILFNGFWRDGNKQNVCMWLTKATWYDAKTGEGGGCKEFAKAAFNMSLPDFMSRFGSTSAPPSSSPSTIKAKPQSFCHRKTVDQIFNELSGLDKDAPDQAGIWLETKRNFVQPRVYIGSGFTNLSEHSKCIFDERNRSFINNRLQIAPQMVVPLRNSHSGKVQNLFFRSIGECAPDEKSRLLPQHNGWSEPDGTPRAFGFPHLITDFPNLVICEGMADYFAAEVLLECEHNFLPIGVSSASALPKWGQWLGENKFMGNVIIIFHLDQDKNGNLSDTGVGQDNAVKCMRYLQASGITARLFPWLTFMKLLHDFTSRDLADTLKLDLSIEYLREKFLHSLHENAHDQ